MEKLLSLFSFFVRILSLLTFETQFIEVGNDDEDGASSGEEEDKRECHEERDGLEGHMDSFHLAEQVKQLLELSAWWFFNMKLFLYLLF